MFSSSFGTEISWLIPAALIGLVAGLWFTRRLPADRRIRAALLLWGGSLIVTALVFSFMEGTIHPYYAIALAPSIAAVVAICGRELWRGRRSIVVRSVLALMIAATGVWSFVLLGRDATWLPWLRWVVLIGVVIGAGAAGGVGRRGCAGSPSSGCWSASLTALGGTAAYTVATAATPHTGSIPDVRSDRFGDGRSAVRRPRGAGRLPALPVNCRDGLALPDGRSCRTGSSCRTVLSSRCRAAAAAARPAPADRAVAAACRAAARPPSAASWSPC